MSQIKAIVDKLLTNASSAYIPEGSIANSVLPRLQSAQKSGLFGKYGTSHLRIERSIVGGRGEYRRVESMVRSTTAFNIESHGLEGLVTEDDYRNVEQPFDAEKDETMGIKTIITLEKEYLLATGLAAAISGVTLAGQDQYSDYNNSDPIDDFKTARGTIMDATGMAPNKAVLDWSVWNILRFHPGILDALGFKDNRPGGLTEAEMASAMGVQEVQIASSRYESAKEGQTSSLAPVWGKSILFMVAPKTAAKYQKSIGYELRLSSSPETRVFKYAVNNPPNSNGILVDDSYDFLIVDAACGYKIAASIA